MVSQSAGRQDSPVDPWEGISNDPGDIDGSPSLLDTDHLSCASNIRFTRHRAAWINPQCVQQQLQDSPPQVPAVGNKENRVAWDAASPLGPSPLSLGDSVVETSLSKGTVDSMGSSSARGSAEKGGDFSLTSKEERAVLPGRCPWTPLFTSSKIDLTASPCREADDTFFKPSQLTPSTDAGNSGGDCPPSCLFSHQLCPGPRPGVPHEGKAPGFPLCSRSRAWAQFMLSLAQHHGSRWAESRIPLLLRLQGNVILAQLS